MPAEDQMLEAWVAEYHEAPSHYLFSQFFGLAGIGRNGHGGFGKFVQGAATINEQRRRVATSVYPGNAPPMRYNLPLLIIIVQTGCGVQGAPTGVHSG